MNKSNKKITSKRISKKARSPSLTEILKEMRKKEKRLGTAHKGTTISSHKYPNDHVSWKWPANFPRPEEWKNQPKPWFH